MYEQDSRAKRSIRTLARDIVGGGWTVDVAGNGPAAEVAADLQKRMDLVKRMDDWIRLTVRDGDSFLEVGVNERMEIAEITRKPTLQMHRASNDADQFPDPSRAFWWSPETWYVEAPPGAVWFAVWQIVHARWDHDEDSRYGSPMFSSATGAWKRVREGEVDIAVRRKTRAGMKFLHVVEGADAAALTSYKEMNKDALNNPFAAVADYFVNRAGAVTAIQGDARLAEIGDVLHHIQTWLMASDVPMELLGYGENLNRDVLAQKKEEYDETLVGLRKWAETDLIKPLVELQWLLAGIWPGGLDYTIRWKAKTTLSPADVRDVADAALKLRALGWPDEATWGVLAQFLPGVDVGAMLAQRGGDEGTPATVAGGLAAAQRRMG
jgi:hypothetical protein